MKHTPGPWTASYDDNGFYVVDAPGRPSPYVVATGGEGDVDKANAEFIVRAVNSHDALLSALKSFIILHGNAKQSRNSDTTFVDTRDFEAFCAEARAALAQAAPTPAADRGEG